jgi:hypothetical protein
MNDFHKEVMDLSIEQCVDSLRIAKGLAKQNRDVEALVLIAERWAVLAGRMKDIDKKGSVMLGFSPTEEEDEDE